MTKTVIEGPGIKVELDAGEIYPSDPGQGTPVLVLLSNGDTGTWNCVTSEGETADGTVLTPEQLHGKINRWRLQFPLRVVWRGWWTL